MPASKNHLKAALLRDEIQIGMWLGMRSTTVAEIGAHSGYDWCLIDGEHGPYDVSAIEAQLQTLEGQGTSAVVRLPKGEDWMVKQMLDLGAQTLLIPMIDTADQAAEMVRAVRYPPNGIRGMGAAVVRASGYNAQPDYPATADDEVCLILQAETRLAMENIDAIANTDGVDCVFIGPADLSVDMGLPMDDPKVIAAIEHMILRVRAAGKPAGIITFDFEQMRQFSDLGVRFLGVGSDVFGTAAWMRELSAKARATIAN